MADNGALNRFISNNAATLNSQNHSYYLDYANFTGSSGISPTFNAVTATGGFTGALTGGVTGNVTGNLTGDVTGNVTGNLTGNVTGDVTGTLTGNVSSNGTSNFNNVSINGSLTANLTGDVTGNVTGRASVATTADKLTTPRSIAGVSFDGDSDITIASTNLSDSSTIFRTDDTQTITNKTINLGGNTISGTTAQFNSALSDGSFRIGYQPGEIIEQLETQADGVGVTVQSGTYTPTNVTSTQDLSTSHAVINGSSIGYIPPTGTTRVIYEFWVFMRDLDVGPILHFAGRVAGTQVLNARHTWRGSTANADYQHWIYNKMILRVGVSESLSAGNVGTWTSSKTLDFTAREYSGSYEGRFHTTNHWDGSGTDILVKPRIRITAIA